MLSRTAECVCTALKVTVPGEPAVVVLCNCKQCQKRTGSIFGVSAYFPEQTVSVSGKSKVFTRVSDRGNTVDCHFCPECGTILSGTSVLYRMNPTRSRQTDAALRLDVLRIRRF